MGDLRARLKPLFRRSSTFSSTKSTASGVSSASDALGEGNTFNKGSSRLKSRQPSLPIPETEEKERDISPLHPPVDTVETFAGAEDLRETPDTSPETPRSPPLPLPLLKCNPELTVQAPTPQSRGRTEEPPGGGRGAVKSLGLLGEADAKPTNGDRQPDIAQRRTLHAHESQPSIESSLLQSDPPRIQSGATPSDYFGEAACPTMQQKKKIWVKRPGSSATQVIINEDDLVDDVRDMILRKYANSLGRTFDSPDVTLRVIFRHPSGRHSHTERTLGPEEQVANVLELYYPGGQAVEEALVIDVPQKRTPRHSPHLPLPYYAQEDLANRPRENASEYFPPMPAAGQHSPHLPTTGSISSRQGESHHPNPHSMAILNTGQLPNMSAYAPSLPSPGGRLPRHSSGGHRPRYPRQQTASPTVMQGTTNAQNLGESNKIRHEAKS